MLKRLRAAIGNSIVWGGAWAMGSVALATVLTWLGFASVPLDLESLLQLATWYGVAGVVAGGAFSTILPLAFRGRDVLTVRSTLFLLGGATAGVLLAPVLPGPIWIAALLGAGTSGGTLAIAKSAARREVIGDATTFELTGGHTDEG